MFNVTFGNFAKRKNSTARPADDFGTAFAVALKEDCSIDKPIFVLTAPSFSANYCKWDNHYYFVTDIVSERNNGWRVLCELDFLATYKDEILATNAFVEYATEGNNQIVDTRLGVEYGVAGVNTETGGGAIPYVDVDINDVGCFVSIVGRSTTDTFYIQPAALELLFSRTVTWMEQIIDNNTIDTSSVEAAIGSTMAMIGQGVKQLIASGNAMECVRDAYCLPIVAPLDVLAPASPMWLGQFDSQIMGNRIIGAGNVERTVSIAIPHHYNDWRRQSPYEVCSLYLPLYGTVNIPSDIAADSDSLTIRGILNVRSGDYTYYISGSGRNNHEIVVGGNCSAPLAVGASNINPVQAAASNALATVGVGAAMGAGVGAIAAAAAISTSLVQPVPYSVGQTGGISNRSPRIQCFIYYRNTSAEPASIAPSAGIPLLAQRQLSTLSGYVQTRDASVSGAIHGEMYDVINTALDSGVFIE